MKVLSLFDWMSWWMLAFKKANIEVDRYFASEVNKYAIQISQKNFPEISHIWDITKVIFTEKIDILIWWSPCQGFSFAWKQLNFEDPRSKLFFEYVRLLKEVKPKYFLLENVKMKKEYQDIITENLFWVEPIEINSNLVSAQNRKRLYWFWKLKEDWTYKKIEVIQPQDKWFLLKDILEKEVDEKYYLSEKNLKHLQRDFGSKWKQQNINNKTCTLTASMWTWWWNVPYFTTLHKRLRKLTPIECERLQTVPDNYTKWVSNTQRYKMLWNGWTIDVIAYLFNQLN